MSEPTQPVTINLVFDGPVERVFDAWLDPDVARHWLFATKGGEMIRADIDPKVDGGFTMTERRGAEEVEHRGRYTVVNRPSRLSFALSVPAVSDRTTHVEIGFMAIDNDVILFVRQDDVPIALVDATEKGWSDMLDRLAIHLAATAPTAGPAA